MVAGSLWGAGSFSTLWGVGRKSVGPKRETVEELYFLCDWEGALKVCAVNMNAENKIPSDTAKSVAGLSPHIVVACECTDKNSAALERVLGKPAAVAGKGTATTAIYTPGLSEEDYESLSPVTVESRDFARIRLLGPGLEVVAVHVESPKTIAKQKLWKRQLRGLRWWVLQSAAPQLVLAGDFNTSPLFGEWDELKRETSLQSASQHLGLGLARTWGLWGKLWLLGLDHMLLRGVEPLRYKTVSVPGSDHKAQVASFVAHKPI